MLIGCRSTPLMNARDLPMDFRVADARFKPAIDLSVLGDSSIDIDQIYPGDVLDVSILTGAEEEPGDAVAYRVGDNGELVLPVLGPVAVSGMKLTEAEKAIRDIAMERDIWRRPTISLILNQRQSNRVHVVGAVNEQGVYELPRAGSNLLAALVAAKGLSEDHGTIIEIRHGGTPKRLASKNSAEDIAQVGFDQTDEAEPSLVHVDLLEAMNGRKDDLSLQDGSVVMVKPRVPETIYVRGLVKSSGEFELPRDQPLRVTQAIALAEGLTTEFANEVRVTRYLEKFEDPIVFEVNLREANKDRLANPVLKAGDELHIVETPTTFSVEFMRQFFRFGFTSAFPGL